MRKTLYKTSRHHIVLSGNILERREFEKPIFYGFSVDKKRYISREITPKEKEENKKRSRNRSRKMVRNLVNSNFGAWIDQRGRPYFSKFLTLTFKDMVVNPKDANKKFTLFLKRLNYTIFATKKSIIKYLAVVEFQKRGAVHYHVLLFNLPYIPKYIDLFNETWGQGYLWIEKIDNERYAANYITKYMTKEDNNRLWGEKSYFCSRNLFRPVVVRESTLCERVKWLLRSFNPTYQNSFYNEHTGHTKYFCYDIKNNPNLKDLILSQQ